MVQPSWDLMLAESNFVSLLFLYLLLPMREMESELKATVTYQKAFKKLSLMLNLFFNGYLSVLHIALDQINEA